MMNEREDITQLQERSVHLNSIYLSLAVQTFEQVTLMHYHKLSEDTKFILDQLLKPQLNILRINLRRFDECLLKLPKSNIET